MLVVNPMSDDSVKTAVMVCVVGAKIHSMANITAHEDESWIAYEATDCVKVEGTDVATVLDPVVTSHVWCTGAEAYTLI